MILKELHIVNFKNIAEASLDLSEGFNCFVGRNGVGKTNVLDAVYHLSMCKSFFGLSDQQNIRHGEAFFMVQGVYAREGGDEVEVCYAMKRGQKKVLKKNGKVYSRLSEHVGLLPLVMIAPEDALLIDGGSEERRRLMDGIISQYNREYLYQLIRYNRVLAQRNALLRGAEGKRLDGEMLEAWDGQLAESGEEIMRERRRFLEEFTGMFRRYYEALSLSREEVELAYKPSVGTGSLLEAFRVSWERDRVLMYTTTGIHRDDLSFSIGAYPIKKLGSQGQKKTFLVALKLAQYAWLARMTGVKPLLLLDDIFDKLDADRVAQIVQVVGQAAFGQVFITDTHRERLDEILRLQKVPCRFFAVEGGEVCMRNI